MKNKEIFKKYLGYDFEKFKIQYENANENALLGTYYLQFLQVTDYLAMKLAEGLITREDKKAEFDARDFARAEINRLQSETK